mgnify:FL=1
MKLWLPRQTGFCHGVKAAVDKALSLTGNAYCLGEIVHNESVVKALAEKGIVTVHSVSEVPDGATMLIRAHGEPPETYAEAKRRNITVVDATCPSVKAIQQKAAKYHAEGYLIVLVGNASHPEIKGINGWCDGKAIVTDGMSPVTLPACEKALVMFQTTFDTRFFEKSFCGIFKAFSKMCARTHTGRVYAQKTCGGSGAPLAQGRRLMVS